MVSSIVCLSDGLKILPTLSNILLRICKGDVSVMRAHIKIIRTDTYLLDDTLAFSLWRLRGHRRSMAGEPYRVAKIVCVTLRFHCYEMEWWAAIRVVTVEKEVGGGVVELMRYS